MLILTNVMMPSVAEHIIVMLVLLVRIIAARKADKCEQSDYRS